MGELKRISARGKLNEVKEFIHQVIDSGEKLVVFCALHEIVDELKKEFPKAVTITGRDLGNQKQASIDSCHHVLLLLNILGIMQIANSVKILSTELVRSML